MVYCNSAFPRNIHALTMKQEFKMVTMNEMVSNIDYYLLPRKLPELIDDDLCEVDPDFSLSLFTNKFFDGTVKTRCITQWLISQLKPYPMQGPQHWESILQLDDVHSKWSSIVKSIISIPQMKLSTFMF